MTEAGEPDAEAARVEHIDDETVASDGGAADVATPWFRHRRVLLGIGAATVVLVVGGVAVASGLGGDERSPEAAAPSSTTRATSTSTSTTTTTSPPSTTTLPPTTVPPTQPAVAPVVEDEQEPAPVTTAANRVPRCGLGPWGESHPVDWDIPGPPGQIELVDGPNNNCTNEAGGCRVTISTTWSDGVTASEARVLTSPGGHTLRDGRGTVAEFWVYDDLYCAFSKASYDNIWGSAP